MRSAAPDSILAATTIIPHRAKSRFESLGLQAKT